MALVAVAFFLIRVWTQTETPKADAAAEGSKQELASSSTDAYFPTGETDAHWSGGMVIGEPRFEDDTT